MVGLTISQLWAVCGSWYSVALVYVWKYLRRKTVKYQTLRFPMTQCSAHILAVRLCARILLLTSRPSDMAGIMESIASLWYKQFLVNLQHIKGCLNFKSSQVTLLTFNTYFDVNWYIKTTYHSVYKSSYGSVILKVMPVCINSESVLMLLFRMR